MKWDLRIWKARKSIASSATERSALKQHGDGASRLSIGMIEGFLIHVILDTKLLAARFVYTSMP